MEIADAQLEQRGEVPQPKGLSPHKLQHPFASLRVPLGVDPGSVVDRLGHTDPTFTLRVDRHRTRRYQASREALRERVVVAEQQTDAGVIRVDSRPPLRRRNGQRDPLFGQRDRFFGQHLGSNALRRLPGGCIWRPVGIKKTLLLAGLS